MLILKDLKNLTTRGIHFLGGLQGLLVGGSLNTTSGSNSEVSQADLHFLYNPNSQSFEMNLSLRVEKGASSLTIILKEQNLYFEV